MALIKSLNLLKTHSHAEMAPDTGVGRRITQIEIEGRVEKLAMNADELVHLPVGVRAGDHREDRIEQHGGQIEPFALGATIVRNFT